MAHSYVATRGIAIKTNSNPSNNSANYTVSEDLHIIISPTVVLSHCHTVTLSHCPTDSQSLCLLFHCPAINYILLLQYIMASLLWFLLSVPICILPLIPLSGNDSPGPRVRPELSRMFTGVLLTFLQWLLHRESRGKLSFTQQLSIRRRLWCLPWNSGKDLLVSALAVLGVTVLSLWTSTAPHSDVC